MEDGRRKVESCEAPYVLRAARASDVEFLWRLHVATMRETVEQVWGWDEDWQETWFRSGFDPDPLAIIMIDGVDAGVLHVDRRAEEWFLSNIEIAPAFQGRGLGGVLINDIIAGACRAGLPVSLQVNRVNRARRLYERLGFLATGRTDTHFLMRRPCDSTPAR